MHRIVGSKGWCAFIHDSYTPATTAKYYVQALLREWKTTSLAAIKINKINISNK
jgi:hypothetical protein